MQQIDECFATCIKDGIFVNKKITNLKPILECDNLLIAAFHNCSKNVELYVKYDKICRICIADPDPVKG